MSCTTKKILVLVLLFFSCAGHAGELDLPQRGLEGVGPVYYVRIFNGFFPIPIRYVLMPSKGQTNELRLLSTKLLKQTAEIKQFNENETTGLIYLGSTKSCSVCGGKSSDGDSFTRVEEYVWKHGIKLKLCHVKSGEMLVFMYNDDFYLSITDGNEELWKILLANFRYVPAKI